MTAISKTPKNKNYLAPSGMSFVLKRAPTVEFFCQTANIPGLMFPSIPEQANPFISIPQTGDHLMFEELQITFKVDEDMKNYREIWDWLFKTGYPEEAQTSIDLYHKPTWTGEGIVSDGSLIINTNEKNPNIEIHFEGLMPLSISSIIMDTKDETVNYVEATVVFRFTMYKFEILRPQE